MKMEFGEQISEDNPTSVDWRQRGIVTSVKDQVKPKLLYILLAAWSPYIPLACIYKYAFGATTISCMHRVSVGQAMRSQWQLP